MFAQALEDRTPRHACQGLRLLPRAATMAGERMKRRVLMVYDRFPPFNVSGSARVFEFAKRLPDLGWQPMVLASVPPADQPRDEEPLRHLPPDVEVLRTAACLTPTKDRLAHFINAKRRRPAASSPTAAARRPRVFTPRSWLWRATGLPMWLLEWHFDWAPSALFGALSDPRFRSVDLVWVSAPHVRNLFVGEALSRLLRKPLLVDLRDPWTYGSLWLPRGRLVARCETARARRILSRAARVVVTSPLTEQQMKQRFPAASFITITNGFSDDPGIPSVRDYPGARCLFRYVGVLNERRTPDTLLEGLAIACRDPRLRANIAFEFVGGMAGHEGSIDQHGLGDVVSSRGRVSQRESLQLMRGADVNVVLQTIEEGQDVIAGKTFEYLAARKPILAVVSERGGDAWLLGQVGGAQIAPYHQPAAIAKAIRDCFERATQSGAGLDPDKLARFERGALTRELATLFDAVVAEAGPHS